MNFIDDVRADIKRNFNEQTFQKGDCDASLSPCRQFRLNATNFWLKETVWDLTKVEIYNQNLNTKMFEFFINDSQFFYGWLTTNSIDYLICAEDIYGGQTLVDLTNKEISGYSPNEDGFIWTDFYLSPDGKVLATIGCYWACPYVVKLFDFSDPMKLPLKEIKEIALLGDDETITGWYDNETLKMKGIQRERIREYDESGAFITRTLSEISIERKIKI